MSIVRPNGRGIVAFVAAAGVLVLLSGIGLVALWALFSRTSSIASERERAAALEACYIGLAGYHNLHQSLPPAVRRDDAGNALSSWRLTVVEWCQGHLPYVDFESRWDSAVNVQMRNFTPWWYCLIHSDSCRTLGHTNVCAISGPQTAFDDGPPVSLASLPPHLVLLVEVAESGVHWMEPGDLDVETIPPSITNGLDGTGVHVVFADGAVWLLASDVPLERLKKFLTIEQARQHDRHDVLEPYVIRQFTIVPFGSHLIR